MRVASPTRVYLPQESRSTMIIERSASVTCMTRHRPASAMYPVLDKPMSQPELRVRLLVLPQRIGRRPILTWYAVDVRPGDRHRLVRVELCVQGDDRSHQLGERRDRQLRFHVLAEENFAGLLVDDQRGLGFQRRLAQLARGHRARNDRQCKERYRDEPHPSSQSVVGPASLALARFICNENNRIHVTLHTRSRKRPILLMLPPARPPPAVAAPTSGRRRRLALASPYGCPAPRYGPDPER